MNTATVHAYTKNSFFGLAIGYTVVAGAVAVGGISGGAFNPAVATTLQALAGDTCSLWLYWTAEIFAAVSAAGPSSSLGSS